MSKIPDWNPIAWIAYGSLAMAFYTIQHFIAQHKKDHP